MNLSYVVPLLVGAAVVVQGGLNRMFGGKYGLPVAMSINAAFFTLSALTLWAVARWRLLDLPPGLSLPADPPAFSFRAAYIIPGLCGFVAATGTAYAVAELGAMRTFVGVVAAQMVASAAWDTFVLHQPPGWQRLAGAGLALAGVAVASAR